MKKAKKLILWNTLILGLLLILVNSLCWLIICYKDYGYKTRNANLPAMINKNYWEIQEEWYKLRTGYQPFIAWKRHPFNGKYINIDQAGNRKTINEKKGKVVRFFGGSTMWGARIEDKNTIPSLFNNCSVENFEVVNHGETGFNARQELAAMINVFLQKEKTDLVIFYDGVNDVNFLCDSTISIPGHRRENQFRQKLMTQNGTQSYFNANDNILGLGKQLGYLIFLRNIVVVTNQALRNYVTMAPQFPYTCHFDSNRASRVAENLLDSWKTAQKIAQDNGSEFIEILQPNIYSGNAKKDYLKLEKSGLQDENFQEVYKLLKGRIKQENQARESRLDF